MNLFLGRAGAGTFPVQSSQSCAVGLSVSIFCSYLAKGFALQSLTQNRIDKKISIQVK